MPDSIRNGSKGPTYDAKVDADARLHVYSVSQSAEDHAVDRGDGYNVNTGIINISGTAATGLLYFKNTKATSEDFIITSIALGVGTVQGGGAQADLGLLTFINNPTGGDLIDDQTAVAIKQNRNAGSTNEIEADIYIGTDGDTITGGTDTALFMQGAGGRLFATFPFLVPKNKSIALKYDPNLSSGNINVYAALIGHYKNPADISENT